LAPTDVQANFLPEEADKQSILMNRKGTSVAGVISWFAASTAAQASPLFDKVISLSKVQSN
jgi:hypothetical protein